RYSHAFAGGAGSRDRPRYAGRRFARQYRYVYRRRSRDYSQCADLDVISVVAIAALAHARRGRGRRPTRRRPNGYAGRTYARDEGGAGGGSAALSTGGDADPSRYQRR